MGRLAYVITLAIVGTLLAMLDAADLARPRTADAAPVASIAMLAPTSTPEAMALPSATATPLATARARDITDARIIVARLGIDLPLAWGDVARDVPRPDYAGATPERVALVFPGSALPGAGGNTYIYSHARTGMFLTLWDIRPGDVVVLQWPSSKMRYEVQRVIPRVAVTDTSWLDPAGPERLTLQTSTGPNASDPRFIAVAAPVAAQ